MCEKLIDVYPTSYSLYACPLREFINNSLPKNVVWRKNKLGFPVPTEKWVYALDRAFVLDLLDNARSRRFFRIDKLKKEYQKQKVDVRMFARFILAETWMRVFDISGESTEASQ